MPRRIRMAVHRGSLLREPPGGTRMIQMNVRDEDLLDDRFIHTDRTNRRTQRFQRRSRTGFNQRELTPALDEIGSDESGEAVKAEVKGVDAHGNKSTAEL